MSRDRALAVARSQDGLITREQALAAGLSPDAIRHAIRPGGPWSRVLPGLYSTSNGTLTKIQRLRAAVLHTGDGALVTGTWACDLSGLRYGPPLGDDVDVIVGWSSGRRGLGFVRVSRTRRLPETQYWLGDTCLDELERSGRPIADLLESLDAGPAPGAIPVVSAARAVVDTVIRTALLPPSWQPTCARRDGCPDCWDGPGHRVLALRNVRALMCEVVQRRRTSLPALRAEVAAAPHRGGALARLAMHDIDAGCRSAPECELRDLVRTSRILPEPRWNQVLPGHHGIYPDACWVRARLVVEVDSRSFHGFGDAPARTEARRARYASLGWRVLPVSPARLRAEPAVVLREIEAAYLSGGSLAP